MIFKYRKEGNIKRGVKFFIASELAIFLSSYTLYAACNRSQETRKFFYDRPYLKFVTEFYYTIGEKFGTDSVRAYDQMVWSKARELQQQQIYK